MSESEARGAMISNEALRQNIVRQADQILDAGWAVRKWLGIENRRLLNAMKRFWQGAGDEQLTELNKLLEQEPSYADEPPADADAGGTEGRASGGEE